MEEVSMIIFFIVLVIVEVGRMKKVRMVGDIWYSEEGFGRDIVKSFFFGGNFLNKYS